jgi:ABC-type lipoprotein export system ATPase subunit
MSTAPGPVSPAPVFRATCREFVMLPGAGDEALTRFRREHVGFVFQFYNLSPSLTAREYVALVTEIAPHPLDPADALALVGLRVRVRHSANASHDEP